MSDNWPSIGGPGLARTCDAAEGSCPRTVLRDYHQRWGSGCNAERFTGGASGVTLQTQRSNDHDLSPAAAVSRGEELQDLSADLGSLDE